MTLWKYSLKNLRKGLTLHIISALQLTVVMIITVVMVSSVLIRYRYYSPFADIFQSKGLLCNFIPPANYDPNHLQASDKYIADEEIKSLIPDIKDVVSVNRGINYFIDDEGKTLNIPCKAFYYDDDIITRFQPKMAEGRWLNTGEKANCIEGVITEGSLDINVGDKIRMQFFAQNQEDTVQEILIVGKIKDNQKIVGYNQGTYSEKTDITHFYGTASYDVYQESVLLLSSNYLSKNTSILQGIFGSALITFSDNCPQEKIDSARQLLSSFNCQSSKLLSTVNENSLVYIFEHLRNLLPIIITLLIMILCSSISSSALTVRREMKSFAVFYITGLQWKHCSMISLIQALIISLFSFAASLIIMNVLIFTGLGSNLYITFCWETFVCILTITAFYILTSVLMPLLMLSRTTPKQILTR